MNIRHTLVLGVLSLGIAFATGCSTGAPRGKQDVKVSPSTPEAPAYPKPRVEVPNRELRLKAVEQIRTSASSQSEFVRSHAIEASKYLPPDLMREMITEALEQPSTKVRFAALLAGGEMRIPDVRRPALKMAQDADGDPNVQAAAIFALHRLGDTRFSQTLGKLAMHRDRTVRANTAMLLGLLGEPSGVKILRRQLNDSHPAVRLQAAEGMWRLRNREAMEDLIIATVSRYPDDQIIAALALAAPRDPRVAGHIRGMLTTVYPEVNLVAARAMGMLGSDEGYGVAMQGVKSKDARQRQLAAMAFGAIGRMDAQGMLGKLLLEDSDEDVRLAAAAAILQLR